MTLGSVASFPARHEVTKGEPAKVQYHHRRQRIRSAQRSGGRLRTPHTLGNVEQSRRVRITPTIRSTPASEQNQPGTAPAASRTATVGPLACSGFSVPISPTAGSQELICRFVAVSHRVDVTRPNSSPMHPKFDDFDTTASARQFPLAGTAASATTRHLPANEAASPHRHRCLHSLVEVREVGRAAVLRKTAFRVTSVFEMASPDCCPPLD